MEASVSETLRWLKSFQDVCIREPLLQEALLQFFSRIMEELVDIITVGPELLGHPIQRDPLEDVPHKGCSLPYGQVLRNDCVDGVPDLGLLGSLFGIGGTLTLEGPYRERWARFAGAHSVFL